MSKHIRTSCLIAIVSIATSAHAVENYWSAQVSVPLGISAGGGIKLGKTQSGYRTGLDAEAGIGGARVGISVDDLGQGFGFGIRTSMLWTWFEPIDADENQTYLGVDVLAGYDRFVAQIGGYRRVEGDGDDWLLSAGLGWRF